MGNTSRRFPLVALGGSRDNVIGAGWIGTHCGNSALPVDIQLITCSLSLNLVSNTVGKQRNITYELKTNCHKSADAHEFINKVDDFGRFYKDIYIKPFTVNVLKQTTQPQSFK